MNEKAWTSELTTTTDALITEKLTVYFDVIKLFTAFADPKIQQAAKSSQKQDALAQQMTKIGIRLALVGRSDVVKEYVKFREMAARAENSENIVRVFGGVILKMRDDIHRGTGTSPCTIDDMLGSFIVGKV